MHANNRQPESAALRRHPDRHRVRRLTLGACIVLALGIAPTLAIADNWPQWRGPNADGVTGEPAAPTHWSADRHIAWKVKLPGRGSSTPIVWDEQVIVTAQVGKTPVRSAFADGAVVDAGDADVHFNVLSYHRDHGKPLWRYQLKAAGSLTPAHPMHNLASPSAVTDGQRIVAWFASGQIVCLNMRGDLLWQRNLATEISPFDLLWGHGSSPVLYKDCVILLCDHHPAAYLLALDAATGKTKWKVDRGKELRSYSTPIVIHPPGGRSELIVNSNPRLDAYDPDTGKPLWHADGFCKVPVPMPVFADGVIYTSRGYGSGPYMAIRPGGDGDVTDTRVLWRSANGAPYVSSLIHHAGLLYLANEAGVVRCVEAKTGERVWTERVDGRFFASPVLAAGHLYLLSDDGRTVVLKAGRTLNVVARNNLAERCVASPAISQGRLFIRGDVHLFCVAQPKEE